MKKKISVSTKKPSYIYDEAGNKVVLVPAKEYRAMVKNAKLWEHWGEKAQWETDNYGQIILYTDRDKNGELMDWDKIEEEEMNG